MKDDIRKKLMSMADANYKDFSSKLMPTVDKETVMGVRVPLLRSFAKNLTDYDDFLNDLPHKYFEENNLHAFLIEREKSFDKCIEKLESFLPYVDNWATCDGMKPKALKNEPQKLMIYIDKWIHSSHIYTVRYAINLLMSFYLDDNFDKAHLRLVADIKSQEYYVNMMRAWYFATALAKRYEDTLPYIKDGCLDKWTHNKTIQKSIESYRINKQQKDCLRSLRIKNR